MKRDNVGIDMNLVQNIHCWNRHEFGTEYPEQQGHIYIYKRTLTETQLMRE